LLVLAVNQILASEASILGQDKQERIKREGLQLIEDMKAGSVHIINNGVNPVYTLMIQLLC
jgi:hypothetical protein